ncbi:MAG: hypothetical protein ACFFB0_01525 [Promethearchaeota archaeon]
MVGWTLFQTGSDVVWDNPVGWFSSLPLISQILIIVGLIALSIAVLVLVYYLLKGLAYLLYYIFKGLYYLFKGIFLGLYKFFEAFYYVISGKRKKVKQEILIIPDSSQTSRENIPHKIDQITSKIPIYCTECGQRITESMAFLLTSQGVGYCFHCGKEFKKQKSYKSNF